MSMNVSAMCKRWNNDAWSIPEFWDCSNQLSHHTVLWLVVIHTIWKLSAVLIDWWQLWDTSLPLTNCPCYFDCSILICLFVILATATRGLFSKICDNNSVCLPVRPSIRHTVGLGHTDHIFSSTKINSVVGKPRYSSFRKESLVDKHHH